MTALAELDDWIGRAKAAIPPEDRKVLLSPARLFYRFCRFAMHHQRRRQESPPEDDARGFDPELAALMTDLFRLLARHYFRLELSGVENVPQKGPVLLVGNHNGGILPIDGFFTALAIRDHQGPSRAVRPLAHDFLFDDPLLRSYARRLGILRAGHASAERAFAQGDCVLVYPGSDLDGFRTFHDRHKIVLGGRKGFLKLALRSRVPIVPVVSVGTHEQFIVLSSGKKLAKWLKAPEIIRSEVLPLVLSLPWGLTSGLLPYWPLPAQTSVDFGKPIVWPDLGASAADDPEALSHCYREVEGAMQAMLDRLAEGRRFLLGRRREPSRKSSGPA